jgi:hypothetical protein
MAAKTTRITLVSTSGSAQDFEVTHAERLLGFRNSAWTLPENSEYRFENGSIIRHTTKRPKRGVGKKDGNEGNSTPKPSEIPRPDGTDG